MLPASSLRFSKFLMAKSFRKNRKTWAQTGCSATLLRLIRAVCIPYQPSSTVISLKSNRIVSLPTYPPLGIIYKAVTKSSLPFWIMKCGNPAVVFLSPAVRRISRSLLCNRILSPSVRLMCTMPTS